MPSMPRLCGQSFDNLSSLVSFANIKMTVHAHSIGSTVPCGWHASTWRRLSPSPGLLARLRDQRRCRAGYYAATTVRAAAAGVEQGPAGGESSAAPEVAPTQFVEVGVVGPPHGVRGEFKVQPLTDFPEDRLGTPGLRCGGGVVPCTCRVLGSLLLIQKRMSACWPGRQF